MRFGTKPLLALLAVMVHCALAGNVQLCGSAYAKHEIKLLINKAVVRPDVTYRHEVVGERPDMAKLPGCTVLIVSSSIATKLEDEELSALRKWVEDGGNLLLIGRAVNALGPAASWTWAGAGLIGTYAKTPYDISVQNASSPLLRGLQFDGSKPLMTGETLGMQVKPPMRTLLGSEKIAFASEATVGKGKVYQLAWETFRMFNSKHLHPLREQQLQLIRNILDAARPESDGNVQDRLLAEWQKKRTGVLVWTREWQRGEVHGPRFNPPMPSEKELVTEISLHLARREYESVQVNLTPLKQYGTISWKLAPGGFPVENLEFLVQERPDPIPWKKNPAIAQEFPYWLMPPEYVAPKGSPAFKAPKQGDTVIVWLRLNTWGMKAGSYTPKLTFLFDGKEKIELPFHVKVAKTAVPHKRPILLGVGGYALNFKDLAKNYRFLDDLQKHGNEWILINPLRPDNAVIRDTGAPLTAASMTPYAADMEKLPALDFPVLDEWIHAVLRRNLTNFRIAIPILPLEKLFKKAGVPEEKIPAAQDWFCREYSRYLHEKGIRMMVTSKGDELSRKELYETYLPWAKRLTEAGIDCTSTFSFGVSDFSQLIADLSPYTRLWTLNRQLTAPFLRARREGKISLRGDAIVGTYGAGEGRGSEFRKTLGTSRFLGWEAWHNGISNCSPNPWFKGWIYYCDYGNSGETGGIGGERWVSYVDAGNPDVPPADCPFWEGIRDGMEDGSLAYLLEERATAMERPEIVARLKGLIADSPDVPIRGKWIKREHVRVPFDFFEITADVHGYRRAKSQVLDMLDALPASTALFWHQIDIRQAAWTGDAAAREQFRKKVGELFDIKAAPGNGNVTLDFSVSDKAPKGRYRILETTQNGKTTLAVIGGDQTGLKLGVDMFCAFLNQHGRW